MRDEHCTPFNPAQALRGAHASGVVLAISVRSARWRDLLLLSLAALGVRLCFIADPGHVVDLAAFAQWALNAADHPWNAAYEATNANYPPGALVFFELIGRAYRAVHPVDPDGTLLRIALKLPSVAFDLLGAAITYAIAVRCVSHRTALYASALFALNPALIYDSAIWGQNDSITAVTALGAVWCVLTGRRVTGWIVLAFAVLNKPPVLVLGPLFLIEAIAASDAGERRRRLRQTLLGVAGALACGYLVALPFYTERSPYAVYSRLIAWYGVGSSLYPYTSANGFNLYALFGDFFAPDSRPIAFVPLKYWADALFIGIAASVYRRYAKAPGGAALVAACFTVLLGFFTVLTEMHERYLIYALTFAPALAALDRRYVLPALTLTLTQWLNLEYSLHYMWIEAAKPPGIDPQNFAPVLARLCALANIGVLIAALRGAGFEFFGRFVRTGPDLAAR